MRTTKDRIRHAVAFELGGLILIIPLGVWLFAIPARDFGVVAVVSSVIATLWTYLYNLGFDRMMQARVGHTRKTLLLRVAHTVIFEIGLLSVLIPFLAWYLGVTLWEALVMDVAITLFYLVYAFCYNWAYDIVFPIPEARAEPT
ncbi:PACE efflux transporter [Rhodobacteraceae bacterium KMM 6894]|nr:PACE efflux transporter [Rhodobacteraceae bacterium KMM 6894]